MPSSPVSEVSTEEVSPAAELLVPLCWEELLWEDTPPLCAAGWPQAVLVGKTDFIEAHSAFVSDFCEALADNAAWLAAEGTAAQTIIDAVADHLPDGASPTFNANNLTKEVIANCAIRFEYAADCKEEVVDFLGSLSEVSGNDFNVSDSFFCELN